MIFIAEYDSHGQTVNSWKISVHSYLTIIYAGDKGNCVRCEKYLHQPLLKGHS
jgi:hypothetical protein